MMLFERSIRIPALVGRIRFRDAGVPLASDSAFVAVGANAMMRLILMISLHLSDSQWIVEAITRAEF